MASCSAFYGAFAIRPPGRNRTKLHSPSLRFTILWRTGPMKRTSLLIALVFLLALTVASPVFAVSTVVIDAGHGGFDRGGMPGQRVPEKGFTLSVAKRVASKLRSEGFKVVMTRSSDTFVSLSTRCAIANAQSSAVFLSIHFNGAPRTAASGVETYYYSGKSSAFASAAHRELVRLMGTPDRGIRPARLLRYSADELPGHPGRAGFSDES